LIEVCVHELFHCLSGKSALLAFLVILYFLSIDVIDEVLELLKSKGSCLCLSNGFVPIGSGLRLSEDSLSRAWGILVLRLEKVISLAVLDESIQEFLVLLFCRD
jgi:hypothetical protein